MKKNKTMKIIDLIYWSIIIIMTFIMTYYEVLDLINAPNFQNIEFHNILQTAFFSMLINMLIFSPLTFTYLIIKIINFGIKFANKTYKKDRIEKIDLKNDNYYREILPEYSPAVLSYLDDFNVNKEDIVATILMLELKGKIKIKNNGIKILDNTIKNLEKNEKYIFNNLKENNIENLDILEYIDIVKKDALKKGLLQKKQGIKKNIKKRIIINETVHLFAFIVSFVIPYFFTNENNIIAVFALLIATIIMFVMPILTIVYVIRYVKLNTLDPYVRSDEGKVINAKLEGLRKYLVDISEFDDKTQEEIMLWEEYLVYSVMLGINTKIIDEIYNKIK